MNKTFEIAVQKFIEDNFETGAIIISDFPLFPYGQRIVDHKGEEMVVFYDLLTDQIKTIFPTEISK